MECSYDLSERDKILKIFNVSRSDRLTIYWYQNISFFFISLPVIKTKETVLFMCESKYVIKFTIKIGIDKKTEQTVVHV